MPITKPTPLRLRLTALREARGLTRYALARLAGLGPIHYTRIELGKCEPTVPTLRKLAAALGVDVKELV